MAARQVDRAGMVIGLETNAAMLRVARSLPGREGAPIAWQEGDALALPYADAAFDVVFGQLCLQ
jgi:ubiquinone/menaquinone biosynthesis C-methylase UbiE